MRVVSLSFRLLFLAYLTSPAHTFQDDDHDTLHFLGCSASILKMWPLAIASAVLSFASTAFSAQGNLTKPLTSRLILPQEFTPPQSFKNLNLVHTINLEKSYPKESINVLIENVASSPQDEYYLPFTSRQMETIGALEVKDRKNPDGGLFEIEAVEYDTAR